MKTIALCFNIPELNQAIWYDSEIYKKYPGSGWAFYLASLAKEEGVELITGLEAVQRHVDGEIDLSTVMVVQEEDNPTGLDLILHGAKPHIVFCLESPLFTPFFYDKLDEFKSKFKYQLFFGSLGTHPVYFPSFDLDKLSDNLIPKSSDKTVAVIANKHFRQYTSLFEKSPSWEQACKTQLHDNRYVVIQTMLSSNSLDLYGKGWPEFMGKELPPGKKVDKIGKYWFCFCPENIIMDGYVTEKIIDCFVAGTIPVYQGPMDVSNYIPQNTFQPAWGLTRQLSDQERLNMISEGRSFIRSNQGKKWSYQSFATEVLNLCLN